MKTQQLQNNIKIEEVALSCGHCGAMLLSLKGGFIHPNTASRKVVPSREECPFQGKKVKVRFVKG
jgi:hypothetical protein